MTKYENDKKRVKSFYSASLAESPDEITAVEPPLSSGTVK
jgi:hypothetical protein